MVGSTFDHSTASSSGREECALVLVARFPAAHSDRPACQLAAHSPTERATFYTADIAHRRLRGGELYRDT
ncbi:hypothetical protein CN211_27525 [Sinorhizobium meliloti]|nr:hypothetical protein CN211_27525 [Sinorhizobium meliloti]